MKPDEIQRGMEFFCIFFPCHLSFIPFVPSTPFLLSPVFFSNPFKYCYVGLLRYFNILIAQLQSVTFSKVLAKSRGGGGGGGAREHFGNFGYTK
jgi:hypothetical protein